MSRICFNCVVFMISVGVASNVFVNADDLQPPTITVTGTAEVRVIPDEAVLTFSIESREKELDAAVKDNNSKIKAVTEFLVSSKVDSKDISLQVISIRPIMDQAEKSAWKGQVAQQQLPLPTNVAPPRVPPAGDKKDLIKPVGYTARRGLSVTIADLNSFETIYQGLIERGVNDVGGIQFRTTELRKHRDLARQKAIRAAMEKAAAMAGELGAAVAGVQTVTEEGGSRYPNYLGQNSFSNSITPGDSANGGLAGVIKINAGVRVVFRLKNTGFQESK